jgi:hypothetical protein
MNPQRKTITRWRAAALHFALSVLVASLVLAAIYFVWYPGALFASGGGRELFTLIACVDVVIGPLITLIIFVPGKRGLAFDLAVIAILQISALSYGVWVLYESRPVWIVFVKDRFELVRANHVQDEERAKAKPPFNELPIGGPRLAGARLPKDPDEQFRIGISAAAGLDVQTYPQYLVSYESVQREALAKGRPFERLADYNPQDGEEIERLRSRLARPASSLRYLPLRAGKVDLAVVIDGASGQVLEIAGLKPWEY